MLNKYIKLLKNGEVVAFPTETVYGLGADAWNTEAVKKVFETKGRPADNPLIVHISKPEMVEDFTAEIPDDARKLMKAFWPGALTLIFKKKTKVPDMVTGGLPTVALRWPNHPIAQQLIDLSGPLVAPSANSSGKPSPTRPAHVKEDFGDDFPLVEAGETQIGLESTVLDVSESPFCIYRPGAVGKEEIEALINKPITESKASAGTPKSPGTKYSHYSPKAEVKWLTKQAEKVNSEALLLLHHREAGNSSKNIATYSGNYRQMARELYDRFRQADHENLKQVLIEPFSDEQLQEPTVAALHNRITKAIGS